MQTAEKAIGTVNRLYEARNTCRTLSRAMYQIDIEPFKRAVQAFADDKGVSVLSAATTMAKEIGDPVATLWIMAAAVEILEPEESGV